MRPFTFHGPRSHGTTAIPHGRVPTDTVWTTFIVARSTNMRRWIQDPKGVDSLTAMPTLGVTESDARHITAYLYTLR